MSSKAAYLITDVKCMNVGFSVYEMFFSGLMLFGEGGGGGLAVSDLWLRVDFINLHRKLEAPLQIN